MSDLQIIIPTTDRDYLRVKREPSLMMQLLGAAEIIFIGPAPLKELVERDAEAFSLTGRMRFLNENELIGYSRMEEVMKERLAMEGYVPDASSKPGWYYQQFLKMAFCRVCKGDWYMSWDADTIPLRAVSMFDSEGRPCFDVKDEYMPSYFATIKKLLGLDKQLEQSFISEHMLFSKKRMEELIAEIEALPFQGSEFFEKIFFSLDLDNVLRGFSEFETYGTWMTARHPGEYAVRKWKSMRIAGAFMHPGEMTDEDRQWLGRDYDSVTFESYHTYSPELAAFFSDPRYRSRISASQFYQIVLESGYFGETGSGGLKGSSGGVFPV